MEEIINEEQQEFQDVKVWKPMPEDHKLFIFCVLLSAAMILLGVLLVWGKIAMAVAAVLLIALGIRIYYNLQKMLKMERAIFYQDRGEMYIIFPDKEDTELTKYLQGELEVDRTKKPEDILCDLAEWSIICRIKDVYKIYEKKERKFMIYVTYDLIPYPCLVGEMGIAVKEKCFENFDDLMKLASSKKYVWNRC